MAAVSLHDDAWHKPVFISFLLVWIANLIVLGFGIRLPADGLWVEGLLPVAAMATTLVGLRRILPWQNLLAMTAIIGGFGYTAMLTCVRTGQPFGPVVYLDADANPMFGTVPWWVPAMWVVVILNARGVARLTLFRWRTNRNFGLWVIAATCALVVLFLLGLEPVATLDKRYWIWTTGKGSVPWNWYGTPITNFLAWGISAFVVLMACIVWMINKRPAPVVPHFQPVAVWVLLSVWLLLGNAVERRWVAVGVVSVQSIVIALLAWKAGARTTQIIARERRAAQPG